MNFDIFSQDGWDLSHAGERPKSFFECMDSLCELYKNGQRPTRVVIDHGGFYMDSDSPRESDIFDIFSEYSTVSMTPFPAYGDMSEVGRVIPADKFADVLVDYLAEIENRMEDVKDADGFMRQAYVMALQGQYSEAVGAYFRWLKSMTLIRDREY